MKNQIVPESLLPMPRLELRWSSGEPIPDDTRKVYTVRYLLIWKLHDDDGRVGKDEEGNKRNHMELELGKTKVTSDSSPVKPDSAGLWSEVERFDTPFRDGAHASWDSFALGGIPVYVTYGGYGHKV